MKWILVSLFLLGCAASVEQLKHDILTLAQNCGEEVRRDFENKIAEQSRSLEENQLRRSLEIMKENIRCQ